MQTNTYFPVISELPSRKVEHCVKPFHPSRQPLPDSRADTLPYQCLGGPGLERLCFQLAVAHGYGPRLFGRPDQAQYGVDIVATRNSETVVWQCKNLNHPPNSTEIIGFLKKFEQEWLLAQGLPRPTRFIICCPQPLEDLKANVVWMTEKQAFRQRNGVEVEFWHQHLLDEWLKLRPDLVADLFSDWHAEHFCNLDDWRPDLFWPVTPELPPPPELRRCEKIVFYNRNISDKAQSVQTRVRRL